VFENRVERALSRLGVPTNRDIQALAKRVETLTASVQKLTGARKLRAAARKR
jgi:polyhydroxyalkanoate synthesis regulator phasin